MQKRQWRALGWMSMAFGFWTMIIGSFAAAKGDPIPFINMYVYLAGLWVIVTITCFVCGWLEEE